MSAIRVLISERTRLFREGLCRICEEAGYEAAEIEDVHEIVESACWIKPDVILIDAGSLFPDQIRIIGDLREKIPEIKILLLIESFKEAETAGFIHPAEAVKAGARACVFKNIGAGELIEQIRSAYLEVPSTGTSRQLYTLT